MFNLFRKWFGVESRQFNNPVTDSEILEKYKQRFEHSLVGKWKSAEGTFDLMYDSFEFLENGTGEWISEGAGTERLVKFEWRSKAAFSIEFREAEDDEWIEISYGFKVIENDVAKEIILHQLGLDTFYLAITRISFDGLVK